MSMGKMNITGQDQMREEMDEALLGFRVARKGSCGVAGWLRSVRQAVGVPVNEVARQMGVTRWEVLRLEQSELESRIMLGTLRKAAKGLDCELVYALVPCKGSLEDLATKQKEARDTAREVKRDKELAERKPWLEKIGWREAILDALRRALRREGVRIRPRTTHRGDAAKEEQLEVLMKLAALRISEEELEKGEDRKWGNM